MLGATILVVVAALLAAVLALWLAGERGAPMRASTWRMVRAGGLRRMLDLSTVHGYVYLRWINQYIALAIKHVVPRVGERGGRWLANRHHGKVLTPEGARAIISIGQEIPLRDLEQIIPYATARNVVLEGPPDLALDECPCRHARANPCQPTQVCITIGQPFVDFVLEHHPETSRRVTQAEALELLGAEHQRGHLHSAWFKDACMGRLYAICNCCKCCCGGIEAMVKYGLPTIASSGYVAQVEEEECVACGACEDACPFGAIQVDATAAVNWEACMGCGVCVGQCPNEALRLVRDERKGVPLDLRALAGARVVS